MYHLFHLVIPNHDYIAHAVSTDGISWKRMNNALFLGHPGEWDDDMLWTMDVCEVMVNLKCITPACSEETGA